MELLILPLLAAIITFFTNHKSAKIVAVLASLFQLLLTGLFIFKFDNSGNYNFEEKYEWLPALGISFRIGYDAISLLMVVLTNLVVFLTILPSNKSADENPNRYYGLILLMQSALVGVFISLDGFLFYLFWELALIPIYLICGIWGEGDNKLKITFKFFIYTFAGSLFMLAALIYLYQFSGNTFNIDILTAVDLPVNKSVFVLLGFFIAFAIKMPVFPFHTWQPTTYTMAPAQGTMLLSGIMLKMGVYGVIRWMIPLAPNALPSVQEVLLILSIIGIVYGAIIAIRQNDIKKIIAYSSFSHVGLIAAGAFLYSSNGIQGAMIQSFCHGINIVGLFLAADIIEKRTGTRDINKLGGIAKSAPIFSVLFMIVLLGSVAVPLTNGFIGEFVLLNAIFTYNFFWSIIAGTTIILCAVYMLRIYQLAIFGEPNAKTQFFEDLNLSEMATMGIIACFVIGIGLYPNLIFDFLSPSVDKLINSTMMP